MLLTKAEELLFHLFEEHAANVRAQQAEELWHAILHARANPITHGTRALFLHWAEAEMVQLVGDWTFWQPSAPMHKVAGTKLHYIVLEFPDDARLQYKLVVDGNWQLDPANARVVEEGFGQNNEFWMPRYRDRSYLDIGRSVPQGIIEQEYVESAVLTSHREVYFYRPVLPTKELPLNLLLVHDGEEAIRLGKFPTILDNLHALGLIQPTAACFLPPRDRNWEYAVSDAYISFCVEEVLPLAVRWFSEQGIRVGSSPATVGVVGASLGGLLATKTALLYPDAVRKVLAQSPSYWWNKGGIFRMPELVNARRLHVVLQTGTICDARELSSLMARRLQLLGARVDYFEYSQGHTWGNWRTTFADGVRALFPPEQTFGIT
ncbi:MAG: alpha/beta hydrolase-fold protein [Bacteroidota bacterium]|nr:alpha/beta hydrolase-fold protein [Candidatus Kapabacteria bacterium]MDW8271187.1 alpha/beta hydrolase-fold protein [Bacteroidota bacterium]